MSRATNIDEAIEFLRTAREHGYRCLIGGCVPDTPLIKAIDRALARMGIGHYKPPEQK